MEWPYEPPRPSSVCGRIGLIFGPRNRDTWILNANGKGIDGSQCLMPVEGHLPDTATPLPPEDLRHILRRLHRLEEAMFGRIFIAVNE